MSPWMVWVDACSVGWFDSREKPRAAVVWTGNAFRRKHAYLHDHLAFYLRTSHLLKRTLWCSSTDAIWLMYDNHQHRYLSPTTSTRRMGTPWRCPKAIPRWRGWEYRAWYNDLWGHFLPTPKWPRSTCAPEAKCPSAETKSFGPATRGWNLNRPWWRHAGHHTPGRAATLWPLRHHRTPAAKHWVIYIQETQQDIWYASLT